jgi:membrane protease YdiL (CAAX protease family)
MQLPGTPSLLYLLIMIVLYPFGAVRFRVELTRPHGSSERPVPTREQILVRTLLTLAFLAWLAWFTGRTFGYSPFSFPHALRARDVAAGLAALAALAAIRWGLARSRSAEERRNLVVYRWMPQTGRERVWFVLVAIMAGLAEEAAYRGVLAAILTYTFGHVWLAWLIAAAAFAGAHAVQGWKAMGAIFAIALVLHVLVWASGTLVIAMAVHTIYDIGAGFIAGNHARRLAAA